MTETPTPYDEIQDAERRAIQDLISVTYDPPQGAQYSYPVGSQGITQDQYQQMMLPSGDGAIINAESGSPFMLVGHDSDAETNQRNTLILKVSENSGRNEASLAGFFFRQTEDIELHFPPVTANTTYYVTITYDPREFRTNPLQLNVWANTPPRAHGQKHIILWEVPRAANQLLTQSITTLRRHYVSPVITAASYTGLPDPTDVLYGTLGVVRSRSAQGEVIAGTGGIYESHTSLGWKNLMLGEWENIEVHAGNGFGGSGECRWRTGGLDLTFSILGERPASPNRVTMFQLPPEYKLQRDFFTVVFTTDGPANVEITQEPGDRARGRLYGVHETPRWVHGSIYISDRHILKEL